MANPWQTLREAAATRLQARCTALRAPDAVGVWVGENDEALYARARKYGAAAWLRVQRVERDADAPQHLNRRIVTLEVIAVSASLRSRLTAAEAAEELQYQIDAALHAWLPDTPEWMYTAWKFLDQDVLATSPNAVAFRLRFRCTVHLAEYA